MMSRHADASKPGKTTSEAPSHTSESTGAVPATWKNGPAARKTSDGRNPQAIVLWNELATRLRWVRTTPFGRPVVPLVKYTTATSAVGDADPERRRSGRVHDGVPLVERHDPLDLVGERTWISIGDEQRWASRLDDPRQLGRRQPDVQRHEDQPGARHAQVQLDVPVAVGGEDRDPVAGPQSERGNGTADALAAPGERGVVEHVVATDDCRASRGDPARPRQRVGDRQHAAQRIRGT